MKKIIALVLVAMMMLVVAACGNNNTTTTEGTQSTTEAPAITPSVTFNSAVEALDAMFNASAFDAEMKGAFAGGLDADFNVIEGAGAVDASNVDDLVATFHVSEADAANIEEASKIMFMMNANNFTAGAFKLKAGTDVDAFVANLKNSVAATEWMCGFPSRHVIIKLADNYVISVFGLDDLSDPEPNFQSRFVLDFVTDASVAAVGGTIAVDQDILG